MHADLRNLGEGSKIKNGGDKNIEQIISSMENLLKFILDNEISFVDFKKENKFSFPLSNNNKVLLDFLSPSFFSKRKYSKISHSCIITIYISGNEIISFFVDSDLKTYQIFSNTIHSETFEIIKELNTKIEQYILEEK